jgi:hypothetical protein
MYEVVFANWITDPLSILSPAVHDTEILHQIDHELHRETQNAI